MDGWTGQILRVNLTNRTHRVETFSEEFATTWIGGRGFAVKILYDELAPGMVLDEDVVTDTGDTLMFRGEEVTRTLLEQLRPAAQAPDTSLNTFISQKLRVLIPA